MQGSGFEGEFHRVLSSSSEDFTASSGKGQARVAQVMLKAPVVPMNGWMEPRPGVNRWSAINGPVGRKLVKYAKD